MMFEEEDMDHPTGNDKEEEGMNSGGRTHGEIGGLPVGDVTPAEVATALLEYLPHSKDEPQKNRRGRPKKTSQLKEVNQMVKDVSEAGVLHAEPGTFKTPPNSSQKQSTDLDRALENGSPFDQVPKGIHNQEQLFAMKKHNDVLITLAGDQQVTHESGGTVATTENDFPSFSGRSYNVTKSNTETQSEQSAVECMYRKPDGYSGGGEKRHLISHMPWVGNVTQEKDGKGENELHVSAGLSQNPCRKNGQEQGRERGIVEQQETVKMAESVTLTDTPTWTDELTGKFSDCHSSPVIPNASESEVFQSAGETVKELVDGVGSHESVAKHGQKSGPSKKNLYSNTQIGQTVGGPQELVNIQTCDYVEENSVCEKRSSSSFDQLKGMLGKYKVKESDKSIECVRMDAAVNEESSKADVRLVDMNVCQVQPSVSVSFPSTGTDTITHGNIKPKKKMGRPPKKRKNIVTQGTIGILGADCNASVTKSFEMSPQDLSDTKTLETTVCAQKIKRGRGKYIRKSATTIPPQQQHVGMAVESRADILSPPRKRDSLKGIIGVKHVTGTECKESTLLDRKPTAAPTSVRLLPHEQQKRGRRNKIISLNEKTSISFEPQNCNVSQKVMLPPSKIKNELEGMTEMTTIYSNVKETAKEKIAVVRQHNDRGVIVDRRNRETDAKFKRKIGRPYKKKTLIKMAKQLKLEQVRTENATDMYEENHPEHSDQKYKLKRVRKKVELYSPASQLRRYNRACKLNMDYSDDKQEQHKSLSSNVIDPKLDSPSSADVSISKKPTETTKSDGRACVKVTWKKGKHRRNKRKCQQVNIKVEEIQPVFTAFSKTQNPIAFQKILPMLSKETLSVSESVQSTETMPLKNWKMRSKARKSDQMRLIQNDIKTAKDTLPLLIPKAEFEETTSNTVVTENKVVSHKGTLKRLQRKGRTSKFLPPPQTSIESTLSGDKGSRRRGRPSKNKVMLPTANSIKKVKKEMVDSLIVQSCSPSQECPLQLPGKIMSCLNISESSEVKRPRKVDRRRKRFRHQKALELKASSEALIKPPESVGQFTSQIDNREGVHRISQNHSNKRKLKTDDQLFNDSDPSTKRPRKAFSSKRRRKRKRSWWDDRGKDKGVLTEKYPDTTLKACLPSVEGKAEVAVVLKSDFDVNTKKESITSYRNTVQNSNELPSRTQVVAQRSGTDGFPEGVELSDQISLSSALSTEQTNTEKSCEYQGNSASLKNAFNETEGILFNDASNPENQDDETLVIMNSRPLPESCKTTADSVSEELPEKQRSKQTMTSSYTGNGEEENVLETDRLEPDKHLNEDSTRQKSERNGDQQKLVAMNEENVLKEDSVMPITKEADLVETDVNMFVSSESKTLNPANLRSSEMLGEEDGLCDVFPNTPDVEIMQAISSQQNVLILDPDKKGWEKYRDEMEHSDQEFEEGGCIEEDPVESTAKELPLTIRSKARGPGRPPKVQGKKPIECQFCGRPFHHISAYIIHRRVHTGERPYSCQECGKTFAQLSNLNTHRKTHMLPGDLLVFSDQEEVGNEEDGDENEHRSFPYFKDRKPQICSVCGKGFRYSSMLKIHMRVHSGEKPYSCKICGKSFSQACSVRVHEKIHWSVKPYICNLCGKGFSQLGTLRTHFYSHTGVYKGGGKRVNDKVTFQCRTCNKSFSIWHQYNFHLKSHNDGFFSCNICSQQYRHLSDLSFHRQSCGKLSIKETVRHTLVSDTLQKSQKQKGQPTQHSQLQSNHQHQPPGQQQTFSQNFCTSQQQVYQLTKQDTCLKSTNPQPCSDASQQKNHSSRSKDRQMSSPSFSLKSPRKRCASKHALSTAIDLDRKFDPRKYLCPRCGRLFRHLGRLRAHMLTHVRGHSYTCGRCGKTLENWNKFWLHQRVHRQKRGRFFCPKCSKGFRFAGMYKEHLQEHKQLRVFSCSLCPRTFSHRETLKDHQRGQHKKHKCNVCGKGFHLQGNLQRHNLVHRHTHPECCPHCCLLFPNIAGLKDHIITHKNPPGPLLEVSAQQNLLPYQCGECEASFKNLDLLFRHQLCHSPTRNRKPWRNEGIVGHVTDAVLPDHQFQTRSGSALSLMPAPPFQPKISSDNSLQKKSPYVFTLLDDTSVSPSSSTSVPQISAPYTNLSSQQQGDHGHPYSPLHSQLARNKPNHLCKLQSLENNIHLPQTPSPSTAVPFSVVQSLNLPQYTQRSTSVQPTSRVQVQTSPKFEKLCRQKPLRTYEKSKRGIPNAPSSSVIPQNEEDSRDSLECAECGAQFSLVPELYEHYVQHARGEL